MLDQFSLKELKEIVNHLLEEHNLKEFAKEDAINWGDLKCVESCYIVNDEDKKYFSVLIEEASPDCCKLTEYLTKRLVELGYNKVEIRTEW